MFVLSRGRQLLVYVLMEYHQVTAQPVVGLSGGLNSCQKIASLASKAPVRFLILSSVMMLGCGICCLGLRQCWWGLGPRLEWSLCTQVTEIFLAGFLLVASLLHLMIAWLPVFKLGSAIAIQFSEYLQLGEKNGFFHPWLLPSLLSTGYQVCRVLGLVDVCCHFSI